MQILKFWHKKLFLKNKNLIQKPIKKGLNVVNSVFFRYISAAYLKSFFIVFAGLIVFFVSTDVLINFSDMPQFANLILLYIFFIVCMAINYVLPLCLVFGFILMCISLVRNNELVSLYALGMSKNQVVLYPFCWALFFCAVYVGLNFTPFAYAEEYRGNIIKNAQLSTQSENIFIKYNDKFIYIDKLESLEDRVNSMKIFDIKDFELANLTDIQAAIFKNNAWLLERGTLTQVPKNTQILGEGLSRKIIENETDLKGFKPRIIENVANQSLYSITDAILSILAFGKQNINTSLMRTQLYKLFFSPFFAPFIILILHKFFPLTTRFANLGMTSLGFFLVVVGIWGVLYLLGKFTENGLILPEFGIILPVFIIVAASLAIFYKKEKMA